MIEPFQLFSEIERYLRLHIRWRSLLQASAHSHEPTPDVKSPIVISLTTIPDRIRRIAPTLNSILNQTVRPDAIYLNIPYYSTRQAQDYTIPENIAGSDCINILRTEDWGPATKVLPLLKKLPSDSRIIVVDDDQIYPKRLVETYAKYSWQYPEAALCLAGWQVPEQLCHANRKPIEGARTRFLDRLPNVREQPQSVDIVQGASSYLIRPNFFSDAVFNYQDAPPAAFFADDIWISGHLARNSVRRLVVPGNFHYARILSLSMLQTLSLSGSENRDGKNNQALYKFFQKDWKHELWTNKHCL